ncbi:MAG: DUF6541 family protein, partial [Anaerolineae bacterium]|nr:DUF6541 family protein [Anaerolineae bacterium]
MAKSKKRIDQKKYSRAAKNFTLAGVMLVLLLIVLVAFTNRMQADLSFRQPQQDLIMYLTANTQVAQSLPAEQCWNRKYILPVVVDPLPVGAESYYLGIAVEAADDRSDAIRSTKITMHEGINQVTFNTPSAPAGNPDCYIRFSANAEQDLYGLWISNGSTIDAGTMFFNGQAVDYDLVFNSYTPIQIQSLFSAFGKALLPTLKLLSMSILYLLIGLGIQVCLKKEEENQRLIPGLFLGIASVMLLVLVLSTVNIRYANWMLFAWLGIFMLAAIIKLLLKHEQFVSVKKQLRKLNWQDALILVGFLLLLLVRISQTDPLYVPSWMDSIFHANLIEGFLQTGQIPSNLNYHFGYHLLTFLNSQLFHWNIPTAMLITGQWLNALLSLAVFSFVERRFDDRKIAIYSVLLFSLFAIFPAYLVNWSRFSILLGTAFGLIITGSLFHTGQKWSLSLILTTGILLLAQFISHYTSIVLTGFIGLVLAYPALQALDRQQLRKDLKAKVPLGILIGAGIVIVSISAFVVSRIVSLARSGEFAAILTSTRSLTEEFSMRYFWQLCS